MLLSPIDYYFMRHAFSEEFDLFLSFCHVSQVGEMFIHIQPRFSNRFCHQSTEAKTTPSQEQVYADSMLTKRLTE